MIALETTRNIVISYIFEYIEILSKQKCLLAKVITLNWLQNRQKLLIVHEPNAELSYIDRAFCCIIVQLVLWPINGIFTGFPLKLSATQTHFTHL